MPPSSLVEPMVPLFLGITLANLFALGTTLVLGYLATGNAPLLTYHRLSGILAAIVCCATHCIVFTYFIATAKWAQHAIALKHLDSTLAHPTRSFKAQAFPAALTAIIFTFLTAFLGAATDNQLLSPTSHHLMALATVTVNLLVAPVELAAIRRNGALIDRILELANPPQPPALVTASNPRTSPPAV